MRVDITGRLIIDC